MTQIEAWQWSLVIVSSLILVFISPIARTVKDFFKASDRKEKEPSLWLLTSSLVISWIFAKSITNAANLGLKYGIIGGIAYATYYLSFLFAGIIIYQLRVKGKYQSIHHFLETKFGKSALILFSILISFRLFNEVWSNTMVIGSYFGAIGSVSYYAAILVFTSLTLLYSLKGGLKSSLLTDAIQMVLFGILLFIILGFLFPKSENINHIINSGEWSFEGGMDLLLVALIQVVSYPFHDPVMTDRGFITSPKTMRKAFFIAVPLGFFCIVLFSLIGVYAAEQGLSGQAAVEVGKQLGIVAMLALNFIMITSASSTLDSTFSSFSKLIVVDLKLANTTITHGRIAMILVTLLGTIPIFFSPEILSATTISGTMVIGLAPVFLFWKMKVRPIAFHVSVLIGIAFGLYYALGMYPQKWIFMEGDYGALFGVNLIGSIACFVGFLSFKK